MRRTHLTLVLVLSTILGFAPAVLAAGGDKDATNAAGGAAASPASSGKTGSKRYDSPKYMEACAAGNGKYVARDFQGALDAYKSAIPLNPKNPLAYYLMGETELAMNDQASAEASWRDAERNADGKDPTLRARILFVLADLKERQKKWDEAKAAWAAYADWAQKFPQAGVFPGTSTSRTQMIDAALKQDKDYEVVRQRIKDSAAGGVFSDPNAAPPAK